jgi:hypothetical protein
MNDIKKMPKRARKEQAPCSLEQQASDGFCAGAHPVGDGRGTRPQLRPANGWAPTPTKNCRPHAGPAMHPSTRPALQPKHNAHGPAALVRLVAHPAVERERSGLADGQLGVTHKKMDVDA